MFGSVETNRYKKSFMSQKKRNVLWIVWFNENKNDQFVLIAYSLEKRKVSGNLSNNPFFLTYTSTDLTRS